MGKKLGFLLGIGAGYVLGTRAGRERYESIKETTKWLWHAPMVERPVTAARSKMGGVIKQQGEAVTDKVADAVKERLFGTPPTKSVEVVEVEVEVNPAEDTQPGVDQKADRTP